MKNALIFVAGLIVGVVCLYGWQAYRFQSFAMSPRISHFSADEVLEVQSFKFEYGETLRVKNLESDVDYSLTLTRLANDNVEYKWSSATDETARGEGELFERYEEVANKSSGRYLKDVGSSLGIELQEATLEWSSASDYSGYLYYNPSRVTLSYQEDN